MFSWFFRKKEVEEIKNETRKGFGFVKKDILSISEWIKHLDSEKNMQKRNIEEIKEVLSSVKKDIEEIKNAAKNDEIDQTTRVFKTPRRLSNKQTAVYAVQTGVQTAVQTPNFDQFSITERAILWVLLNSDMKLSYDDLAAMLGKERSTIRGQINSIKQKVDGVIEETVEKSGKKRLSIPENMKEKLLKKVKVRVKSGKKGKKR